MSRARRWLPVTALLAAGAALAGPAGALTASGAAGSPPPVGSYRVGDYAHGQAMSILPPGENGLVTASDLLAFEANGTRPPASQDQLGKYAGLLYGYPSLSDGTLSTYYDDASFGVRTADITRTETPAAGVTIYRDTHDVPHVYGASDAAMAFGAGYAQAEDRLFLMDVLRHYGAGTLSAFLGPSCADEQMDHDQLLLSAYTPAQAQAQIDALPTRYGALGAASKALISSYVQGVNAWVAAAQLDPTKLPADYAAALAPPQTWTPADVVSIAGLIGGIFGRGGGGEVANAALLQYLQRTLGPADGQRAFTEFKAQNDPTAPTTVVDKAFPYMTPGPINRATTALPDNAAAPLTGGPTDTTANCALSAPNPTAMATIASLSSLPKHMSNALVVNADRTAAHHPIAVFGPQVSYFAPQILSQEDLHSPDYAAEGASFPGTGLVELGRGADYAWSATSAGSDLIDQRLEKICNPSGGAPAAQGAYYEFNGACLPMTHEVFTETAVPKPGGVGAPTTITHDIYLTRHGIVQGWTTAGGKPAAVVNQRSTYNHDVDSVVGFLGFGEPKATHDVASWMSNAALISYTFNWLYVDNRDTGYFVSGRDPVRAAGVDPNLPSWGTGNAEWQGFLPFAQHVHEVNPPQGFFVSWNNKPAPGFSAADNQFGYGAVYRSQMLVTQLQAKLAATSGRLTRSDVVQAMETAASQDLDGLSVAPALLAYVAANHPGGAGQSAGVSAMLTALSSWVATGAHRIKAHPTDSQYADAGAVATMDELMPNLIEAIFDPLLKAGGRSGVGSTGGANDPGYAVLPMEFVNTPNSGGAHLGSAYDGGYEGYLQTALRQLAGGSPADSFGSEITSRWCGPAGSTNCAGAVDAALQATYDALVAANGGSTSVTAWTNSTDSAAAKETMPIHDAIHFRAIGVVGQPAIDWQNRPTFQQVVQFPAHRAR